MTQTREIAVAGLTFAGGRLSALVASLLLGAALLLAPGAARAQGCGGAYQINSDSSFTCAGPTHSQVRFLGNGSASITIIAPGETATTISGTTTNPSLSITAADNTVTGDYAFYVGARPPGDDGATGAVSLTSTGRGVAIDMLGSAGGTATVEIGSAVTMGSLSTRIGQHGVRVRGGRDVTITNAGTIYATFEGIDVAQGGTGTLTVTHSGTINSLNHGIQAVHTGTGPLIVTNSGDVAVTNANQQGIRMEAGNNGAMTLTATGGTITTLAQGIYMESRGTGAVTIKGTDADAETQSGPTITSSGSHGIHVHKSGSSATAGDISITTTGGSITPAGTGNYYGIYVQDSADYSGSVTIDNAADITAGSHAIRVERLGSGDVDVAIAAGATAISYNNAGILAELGSYENSQIAIDQGGAILGRTGIRARVARHSTDDPVVARPATDQPVIDIDWTGTFAAGTTAQTAQSDRGRFAATALDQAAVVVHRGAVVERVTRYGLAAGIEAQIMSIGDVATFVANGDDPLELMNPDAQTDLLTGVRPGDATVSPGTVARRTAIANQFRTLVEAEDFASITDANAIDADNNGEYSDTEIWNWLENTNIPERRAFLRDLLRQGLSEGEEDILEKLTGTGDDRTLDARTLKELFEDLPTWNVVSWYDLDWQREVQAFLDRYNVGNIRISVNAGDISSWGDGIRAYYATPHEKNGAISVTVAQGASVTGGKAGIWVANAGDDDEQFNGQRFPKQHVTVNGRVKGGTDAAVHLVGGGFLTVGKTAEILAGQSGRAILVNDPGPARIVIDGLVRGGRGALAAVRLTGGGEVTIGLNGRIEANGAASAIRGDKRTNVIIYASRDPRELQDKITRPIADVAADHVTGLIVGDGITRVRFVEYLDGISTGEEVSVPVKDGRPDTSGLPDASFRVDRGGGKNGSGNGDLNGNRDLSDSDDAVVHTFRCDRADGRCRLYEALPSILLAMNAPATRDERMAAARGANGVWTRILLADGRSKVESSTRPDVAYDRQRNGVRAGVETTVTDGLRVGGSVHGFRGVATLSGGNEAKLSSAGAGAYLTALAGGFHWDMQATATRYEVDLMSPVRRRSALASDVSGTGYAMTVEVGRPMTTAPDVFVTPRVGLAWSRVSLDDFTDSVASTAVSVESAESLSGRVGAAMEASLGETGNSRMFATFDVQHAFSTEMETVVKKKALKTTTERTSVRFGLGGSFDLDDAASLRVSADYMRAGGGNRELGGSLNLTFRF